MSAFYPAFYGPAVQNMDRVYQLMSYQAQLWTDTWDTVDSKSRKPIWGNSEGIFHPGHPAEDQAIPLPPVPSAADLNYSSAWSRENAQRLRIAEGGLVENEALVGLLNTNLRLAESNRYSLEVFLSIAHLCRQNLDMLRALGRIDASLASAQEAAKKQEHRQAVEALDRALAMAREIRARRNAVLRDTIATWQKSWEPRVSEANGRRFLHELDDVKDHLPDRTVDMSYLVYRERLLPLGDWYKQVESVRNQYAAAHGVPVRQEPLAWEDLK
jgi:hypothetical protein